MSRKQDQLDFLDRLEWGRPYKCRDLAVMVMQRRGLKFQAAVGFVDDLRVIGYLDVAGSDLLKVNESKLVGELLTYRDPGQQKIVVY